jgi:hypothetical protein
MAQSYQLAAGMALAPCAVEKTFLDLMIKMVAELGFVRNVNHQAVEG